MHKAIKHIGKWYFHFERPISSFSLVGGFIFNALVLTRVDLFWENFWIVVHLVVAGVCIVLLNRNYLPSEKKELEEESDPLNMQFWLITVLQFTFGGLLSTFIVFYFRSAVLAVTWPFFLTLGAAFLANERLKERYTRTTFQIVFLFLSAYIFAIYFVPVLMHDIGSLIFLISGIVSIIFIFLFTLLLHATAKKRFRENRNLVWKWIAGIFIIINTLYFFNLIPPLPLGAEDAEVYHLVTRTNDGGYSVLTETPTGVIAKTLSYLNLHTTYTTTRNAPAYAYTAIFSPVEFATDIIHQWQYYDKDQKQWITSGSVVLPIIGGRDGGYRTYSIHRITEAGKWRVNIKTETGQHIGRINFVAVISPNEPKTTQLVKQ